MVSICSKVRLLREKRGLLVMILGIIAIGLSIAIWEGGKDGPLPPELRARSSEGIQG